MVFFVLDPDYKRAAYLEGIITDASSNTSLSGVTVEILNSNNNTLSNVGGEFKLGTLNPGTYSVVFSHPLFQSDTINQVVLQNDSTTILNLVMYSLTPLNLNIESKSSALNSSLSGVDFIITNEDFTYSGTTDQNGLFTINNLIPGSYNIYAGLWSYKDFCVESLNIISDNTPFLISLEEGYRDRFNIDMGWTVNSSAASGLWERDIPTVTIYNNSDTCSPAFDSEDCGNMAFITGNLGSSPSADDVDLGYVQLVSPTISLDSNQTNYLHCNLWWRNFLGGTTPDDTLFIDVNDGVNKENLFFIHSDNPKNWYKLSLEIPNTINLSSFKIEITTADWGSGVDHLVEAGIDNLYVDNDPSSNISQVQPSLINVFPNPTPDGIVQIQGIKVPFEYSLYNISGKLVQFESNNFNNEIDILEKGIYILRIKQESKVFYKRIIF
ncbi:MAG: carboxypeptidase regulatory-like domain-containing protein [Parvicellaceae bacterium]